MILDELAASTQRRIIQDKNYISSVQMKKDALAMPRGNFIFHKTLTENKISLICEIKRASPSKGIISEDFPYLSIARAYEEGGADCLSVLTEPEWFKGSDSIFKEIRKCTSLPILRKDFTVDSYQIYQAKVMGADCVLLICALLSDSQLREYLAICDELGLSALVETHNELEIHMALQAGAQIIGVNNRNLKDFSINIDNAKTQRQFIPADKIFVSESGIQSVQDGISQIQAGANALLIGEALMRSNDKHTFIQQIKEGANDC